MHLLTLAPPRSRFPWLRKLLAALIAIGLWLAAPVHADIRGPMVFLEDAVEANRIEIRVDDSGRGDLTAFPPPCEGRGCAPRTFRVDGPVVIIVNGRPRPRLPLRALDGQAATVIFDIKSERVLRLVK